MKNENKPFFSVIVPVYHDWDRLQLCLNALEKQNYPKELFEIIVVNNDPKDKTPNSLSLPTNCQLVREEKPGSYAARNRGASLAKGDILSFTDADCIPDANWLNEIFKYYQQNEGILSGAVEMFSTLKNKNLNFAESYDYVFGINQVYYALKKEAATANLSITAKEFFINDGFRVDMFSGGDVDFCQRAKRKNIKFAYLDKAIVKHPLRNNLKDLIIKGRRLAGGKVYKNKIKGLVLATSPPIVRIKILFFNSKAPLITKLKCLLVIFIIKTHQFTEACKVAFGAKNERL